MSEEKEVLSSIADEVRACRRCPLWEGRINAVPGDGPSHARLMIVGEAPGRNEDREGLPFVGAAGRNLEALLSTAGLKRSDAFITNIVKCRPPVNRRPTRPEADTCHQYLIRQIRSVKPEVIVLLGDTALKQFFRNDTLPTAHGTRLMKGDQVFFATYHPASVIYNPSLRDPLLDDFRKLGALLSSQHGESAP